MGIVEVAVPRPYPVEVPVERHVPVEVPVAIEVPVYQPEEVLHIEETWVPVLVASHHHDGHGHDFTVPYDVVYGAYPGLGELGDPFLHGTTVGDGTFFPHHSSRGRHY